MWNILIWTIRDSVRACSTWNINWDIRTYSKINAIANITRKIIITCSTWNIATFITEDVGICFVWDR